MGTDLERDLIRFHYICSRLLQEKQESDQIYIETEDERRRISRLLRTLKSIEVEKMFLEKAAIVQVRVY